MRNTFVWCQILGITRETLPCYVCMQYFCVVPNLRNHKSTVHPLTTLTTGKLALRNFNWNLALAINPLSTTATRTNSNTTGRQILHCTEPLRIWLQVWAEIQKKATEHLQRQRYEVGLKLEEQQEEDLKHGDGSILKQSWPVLVFKIEQNMISFFSPPPPTLPAGDSYG